MSLINTSPPELSTADKQALAKQSLITLVTNAFNGLITIYRQGYDLVHNNAHGLTADEVLAGLGDDAAELTRLAGLLKDVVNAAQPGTVVDPPEPTPAPTPDPTPASISTPAPTEGN